MVCICTCRNQISRYITKKSQNLSDITSMWLLNLSDFWSIDQIQLNSLLSQPFPKGEVTEAGSQAQSSGELDAQALLASFLRAFLPNDQQQAWHQIIRLVFFHLVRRDFSVGSKQALLCPCNWSQEVQLFDVLFEPWLARSLYVPQHEVLLLDWHVPPAVVSSDS